MKKLSILFAIFAMTTTLGVAGCKKKEEAKTDVPAAKTTDETKPADTAKPADPATPATPATTPTSNAASADLPAECAEYKGMMEKLASCEKMPQQSRDALKQGFDAMSASWANAAAMPPEAKQAMADGCKQGAEALKTAAAAQCGW
ncbi:MAG: hypothetical protein H0T89_15785 [Deltaproteobacteria bacterium]|nr:hypothetical protein [Deltaproteobacteria bacterium]MDQ3295273.1 hypothetical protein [Myxococcota bacterium]